MSDQEREFAWKKSGRGNGLRWLILRDLTAGLSMSAMPSEKAEDFMVQLRGINWSTTRKMLQELERMGAIEQTRDEARLMYTWSATSKGVAIFCGKRTRIPVRIAQAAWTTMNVSPDEAKEAEAS